MPLFSVLSTYAHGAQMPVTPVPGGSNTFFWPLQESAYMCTYSHRDIHGHIIEINLKKNPYKITTTTKSHALIYLQNHRNLGLERNLRII